MSDYSGNRYHWFRVRLVEALAQTYGTDCCRCHRPIDLTLPGNHRDGPSFDHLELSSTGGPDHFANLRLAHLHCNRANNGRIKIAQAARRHRARRHWGPVAGQGTLL